MKFKTWYNQKIFGSGAEVIEEPSRTVPGQSLSVREILDRYTRGISPTITKNPQFSDVEDFDHVDYEKIISADLTDVEKYTDSLRKDLNESLRKDPNVNEGDEDVKPQKHPKNLRKGESESHSGMDSEENTDTRESEGKKTPEKGKS